MRRVTGVIGALLIATSTAGCLGGEEEPKVKQQPKAATSAARPQPPTPTPAGKLAPVTLPDQPGPLVDLITRQVKAAGSVRAELVSLGGQGATRVDERTTAQMWTGVKPPDAQMTIVDKDPKEPGTTEAIITGGTVYTRVDGQEQAPGKPWVRLSRQDVNNPELGPFAKVFAGILDGVDSALGQLSTDTGLSLVRKGTLKGAPTNESLAGQTVRHYRGSTPTAAMAGEDKSFEAMSKIGVKQIPWTLWVDAKGLPAKFQADLATPQGMKLLQSATYRQWGEPLEIQVPPAAKVHTMGS